MSPAGIRLPGGRKPRYSLERDHVEHVFPHGIHLRSACIHIIQRRSALYYAGNAAHHRGVLRTHSMMNSQNMKTRERGFSAIEMLISVALITLVLGVAFAGMRDMQARNFAEGSR